MKLTPRAFVALFAVVAALLAFTLIFKTNITGYAVFATEVLYYPVYDYIIMALICVALLSLLGFYFVNRAEEEARGELAAFNIAEPNISITNLNRYLEFCLSEKRNIQSTKDILRKAGWDQELVDEEIEQLGKK